MVAEDPVVEEVAKGSEDYTMVRQRIFVHFHVPLT